MQPDTEALGGMYRDGVRLAQVGGRRFEGSVSSDDGVTGPTVRADVGRADRRYLPIPPEHHLVHRGLRC
jgi:hypothetical protein